MITKIKDYKFFQNLVLGIGITLLIIFVFGMICVVSKYDSVTKKGYPAIFGLTVQTVSDSQNSAVYPKNSKVLIKEQKSAQIKVGDFVVYNVMSKYLSGTNFAQVVTLSQDNLVIKTTESTVGYVINKSQILGVASTNDTFACGLIGFLLSDATLWLLVIIPCLLLIVDIFMALCLFLAMSNRQKSLPSSPQFALLNAPQNLMPQVLQGQEVDGYTQDENLVQNDNLIKGKDQIQFDLDALASSPLNIDMPQITIKKKTSKKEQQSEQITIETLGQFTELKVELNDNTKLQKPTEQEQKVEDVKSPSKQVVANKKNEVVAEKTKKISTQKDDNYLLNLIPKKQVKKESKPISIDAKNIIRKPIATRIGDDYYKTSYKQKNTFFNAEPIKPRVTAQQVIKQNATQNQPIKQDETLPQTDVKKLLLEKMRRQ